MSKSRKKPSVAFWATVAVVGALAYPISFGPACWWFSPRNIDYFSLPPAGALKIYWPIGWLIEHGPKPMTRAIRWYALLRIDFVWVQVSPSGDWKSIAR